MFWECECRCFRKKFSQRQYHGGGNHCGGQNDSDYMKQMLCALFFRDTTVQDPPGAAENTRCDTDT